MLEEFAALAEDTALIPSATHNTDSSQPCVTSFSENHILWSPWALGMHVVHMHARRENTCKK